MDKDIIARNRPRRRCSRRSRSYIGSRPRPCTCHRPVAKPTVAAGSQESIAAVLASQCGSGRLAHILERGDAGRRRVPLLTKRKMACSGASLMRCGRACWPKIIRMRHAAERREVGETEVEIARARLSGVVPRTVSTLVSIHRHHSKRRQPKGTISVFRASRRARVELWS